VLILMLNCVGEVVLAELLMLNSKVVLAEMISPVLLILEILKK